MPSSRTRTRRWLPLIVGGCENRFSLLRSLVATGFLAAAGPATIFLHATPGAKRQRERPAPPLLTVSTLDGAAPMNICPSDLGRRRIDAEQQQQVEVRLAERLAQTDQLPRDKHGKLFRFWDNRRNQFATVAQINVNYEERAEQELQVKARAEHQLQQSDGERGQKEGLLEKRPSAAAAPPEETANVTTPRWSTSPPASPRQSEPQTSQTTHRGTPDYTLLVDNPPPVMKCFADLLGTTKAPLWRKSPRGEAELNEQARHADEKDGLVEGGAKYRRDLKYYPPSYEHVQQDWKMAGEPEESDEVVSEGPGGVEVQQRRGVFETQMSKFLQLRGFDANGADADASMKDEDTSTTTVTSTPMREPQKQGTSDTETDKTQKSKKYTDGLDNDFFWRSLLTKTSPEDAPRAGGVHPPGSGTGINFHVQNNGIHALDFERPSGTTRPSLLRSWRSSQTSEPLWAYELALIQHVKDCLDAFLHSSAQEAGQFLGFSDSTSSAEGVVGGRGSKVPEADGTSDAAARSGTATDAPGEADAEAGRPGSEKQNARERSRSINPHGLEPVTLIQTNSEALGGPLGADPFARRQYVTTSQLRAYNAFASVDTFNFEASSLLLGTTTTSTCVEPRPTRPAGGTGTGSAALISSSTRRVQFQNEQATTPSQRRQGCLRRGGEGGSTGGDSSTSAGTDSTSTPAASGRRAERKVSFGEPTFFTVSREGGRAIPLVTTLPADFFAKRNAKAASTAGAASENGSAVAAQLPQQDEAIPPTDPTSLSAELQRLSLAEAGKAEESIFEAAENCQDETATGADGGFPRTKSFSFKRERAVRDCVPIPPALAEREGAPLQFSGFADSSEEEVEEDLCPGTSRIADETLDRVDRGGIPGALSPTSLSTGNTKPKPESKAPKDKAVVTSFEVESQKKTKYIELQRLRRKIRLKKWKEYLEVEAQVEQQCGQAQEAQAATSATGSGTSPVPAAHPVPEADVDPPPDATAVAELKRRCRDKLRQMVVDGDGPKLWSEMTEDDDGRREAREERETELRSIISEVNQYSGAQLLLGSKYHTHMLMQARPKSKASGGGGRGRPSTFRPEPKGYPVPVSEDPLHPLKMNLEAKFVGVSNIGPTSLAVDDARAPHDQGSFDWRTGDEWVTTGQIKFDFEVPLPPLPLRAAAPNGLDMYDEAVVGRPEPRQRRNPYDREAQVIQNQMQFDYRLRHEQLRAQRRAGHLTVVDEFFQGGTRAGEVGAEEEGGRRVAVNDVEDDLLLRPLPPAFEREFHEEFRRAAPAIFRQPRPEDALQERRQYEQEVLAHARGPLMNFPIGPLQPHNPAAGPPAGHLHVQVHAAARGAPLAHEVEPDRALVGWLPGQFPPQLPQFPYLHPAPQQEHDHNAAFGFVPPPRHLLHIDLQAHQEAMNRLQVNPFVLNQESQTRKITVFYRQQRHASDPRKTRVAVYVQCGNRYPEHVAGGRGGLTHWFAGPLKEESTEFSFEVRRTRTEVEVATER